MLCVMRSLFENGSTVGFFLYIIQLVINILNNTLTQEFLEALIFLVTSVSFHFIFEELFVIIVSEFFFSVCLIDLALEVVCEVDC